MDRIKKAFDTYPRKQFLPADKAMYADSDIPIYIGHGQTNSQPSTVQRMLVWLNAQPGEKVLDVGSGSGWTTALLSHIVGSDGHVYATERIPELLELGKQHCKKQNITNISFSLAGTVFGLPEHAPYKRILVSAAASEISDELIAQLAPEGTLVIPVQSSILEVKKRADGSIDTQEHMGYSFVPLVNNST